VIPEEKIAEIRAACRISEFISPHISLKRRGRSLMGLCPFHNEKSPSFSVNDDNGFYHCFGCNESGNVFKFLMQVENISFPESVRKVAERYGITVPETDDPRARQRASLYDVNASAARYFRRCLLETPAGKPILEYLSERGIGDDACEEFTIGAASTSGDGLVRWFAREGVDSAAAVTLGLLGSRGNGLFDRFRGRLMFPIRDGQGRVIGFGGRVVGDANGPKYLNSPESEVYRKSRALYGIYEARKAMRDCDELLLVEGYLDVVALHQSGVCNVVATCGTALTPDQARAMRRHASEVVTLFDADTAGGAAAARSFPIFIEAGIWSRAALLPDGEDPDSFVRSQGADALREKVRRAAPLAEVYAKHRVASAPAGTSGLAHAAADMAEILAKVEDPFEYDLLISKAALWTEISEDELRRQSRRRRALSQQRTQSAAPQVESHTALPRPAGAAGPEELLACALLAGPDASHALEESIVLNSMENGVWKQLVDDIIGRCRAGRSIDPTELAEGLPGDYRSRVMHRLLDGSFADAGLRSQVIADCVSKIEERARRAHNRSLLMELKRREELGVDDGTEDGLAELKPRKRPDA
jgi:DNA primase